MKSIPVIFALLPGKSQDVYRRLFSIFRELLPGFQPSTWICDFEAAIRNAVKDIFPSVQLAGCFFHLMQNLLKKVKAVGLYGSYCGKDALRRAVRLLGTLAFLPLELVHRLFRALANRLQESDLLSLYPSLEQVTCATLVILLYFRIHSDLLVLCIQLHWAS